MSALGIDFGTSKCRVFAAGRGVPTRICDSDGASAIPALVACSSTGQLIVGAAVWRATETSRAQLVRGILRIIGRRFYSRETEWLRHSCSFDIVPSPTGDAWIRVGAKEYSPEEIVAAILRHIVDRTQQTTGERVERAVIAIPNTFDQLQRRAMRSACAMAGLDAPLLLQASSALACVLPGDASSRAVALDMGAGYIDVALIERVPEGWSVVANSGDGLLGGMDFDRRIVELIDPESAGDIERLCLAAERLRHALSTQDHVDLTTLFDGATEFGRTSEVVSRAQHDEQVQDELLALAAPCGWVLEDTGLGTDDVDQVLLMGGMMRDPSVVAEVAQLFRRPPVLVDGDDLLARGALACAVALGTPDPRLPAQVSPRNVGVKVRGGLMSPIAPRGQRYPWSGDTTFAALREGQERIVFEVYEGDAERAHDNLYLGTFVMEDVWPNVPPIVTVCLGHSGELTLPGWRAGERAGAVDFRWAGAHKPSPLRDAAMGATNGGDYARLVPDDDEQTAVALDIRGLRDSARPLPSAPPGALEQHRRAPRADAARPSSVPPPPSGDALVGSTVGGRYVIGDLIAEGGMGRVYRARHATLGREFAVKVLHPELANNEELAARFLREAQSASRIESDHVIDIVDFGRVEDGSGYFVMEYLKGTTLRDLIDQRGHLPVDLARDIAMQIADGVAAAHELDIIHRDLKPDNVLLIERRQRPYFCKILDFGIAKHPTSSRGEGPITLAGSMVGSPYYMSPEQIIAGPITPRTDVYAMGVVLYEMLTGVPPFTAESVAHLLQQHMDVAPAPVKSHEVAASCPAALDALVQTCLAKDPDDRVESATALVQLLAAAV